LCAQFRVRNHNVNAAVVQNVINLGGLEKIVNRHDDCARLQNSKHACGKFRAIFQPDSDTVAGLDAEIVLQMPGDCLRLRQKFGVGNFPFAVKNSGFRRVFLRAIGESGGEVHEAKLNHQDAKTQNNFKKLCAVVPLRLKIVA
jgi:hypothetical protein